MRDLCKWIGINFIWKSNTVEACLRQWFQRWELKDFSSIPLLTLWGIWLERNALLFQVYSQSCAIFKLYRTHTKVRTPRKDGNMLIDKTLPCVFAQGTFQCPEKSGIGNVIYLLDDHFIKLKLQSQSGWQHKQYRWIYGTQSLWNWHWIKIFSKFIYLGILCS